ncbi:hypothetical protein, partial [Methylophaga sp. UBA1464]|uniref:hypothetical protein n=1 Tax=Methylophaga sp. UBA1464 TaxID=1946866 RepID=UPI0025FAE007
MKLRLIGLLLGLGSSVLGNSVFAEEAPVTLQTLTDHVFINHPARQAEASMDALAESRSTLAGQLFAERLS